MEFYLTEPQTYCLIIILMHAKMFTYFVIQFNFNKISDLATCNFSFFN